MPFDYEVNVFSRPRAIISIVACLAFGVICASAAPAYYFDWTEVEQGRSIVEEILISVAGSIVGLLAIWAAGVNIARFFGPDFDVRVYDYGLVLHPSVYGKPIPWTSVSRSRVKKTQGGDRGGYWHNKLELELTQRIWSLALLFPTRKLRIRSPREWGHNPVVAELGRYVRARRLAAGWKR